MKLDEIEELILSNRSRQAREPAAELVVRAVRQLGARVAYWEETMVRHRYTLKVVAERKPIDPDVLELIGVTDAKDAGGRG